MRRRIRLAAIFRTFAIFMMLSVSVLGLSQQSTNATFDETLHWIIDFLSRNEGHTGHLVIARDLIHRGSGDSLGDTDDYFFYSDIQRIEIYEYTNLRNDEGGRVYSVRISGQIYDCSQVDNVQDGSDAKRACPRHPGYFDLDFVNKNVASKENCQRLLNAFQHLAELSGAKVNQKEPF